MPVKNVFLSKVKEMVTGMNDPFVEELRSITGPKRVFPMKANATVLGNAFVEKIEKSYEGTNRPLFPKEFSYEYHPFHSQISAYGIAFDQPSLLNEAALLFAHVRDSFCDKRGAKEIATDVLMVVFWANLLIGYFEHLVESELYRNKQLQLTNSDYLTLCREEEFRSILTDMKLAYAFKHLSLISAYSRIPNGNPFDYQWVCRYYLRRKIDVLGGSAMDYVGETRWYDGLERLLRALISKDSYNSVLKQFPMRGIDELHNIPVYLVVGDQMPVFSTTIKSAPRTLDDVLRETKETNQKFFREILHMVEFSFDLSVNLDHDVGFVIESPDGKTLLEMYPRTHTQSLLAPFCDVISLPESALDALREEGREELIKELIQLGFEMEASGKMILVLSEKIGWQRWNSTLSCLRRILKI
ncbi:MAG: hypothetical protein KBC39_05085 [Thermotogae bacterium]|nr:hypothetical protein [Thermotogota bacterium]HPB86894.1 hypothetical protein [Thermotogota bacterium]HQN22075.1 hypothetical protein [Thermotogota bacterium]HQQ66497.1 hypothetical protein [Thermotogota bacterium]